MVLPGAEVNRDLYRQSKRQKKRAFGKTLNAPKRRFKQLKPMQRRQHWLNANAWSN